MPRWRPLQLLGEETLYRLRRTGKPVAHRLKLGTRQRGSVSSASSVASISSLSAGLIALRFSGRFKVTQAIGSSLTPAKHFLLRVFGTLQCDLRTLIVDGRPVFPYCSQTLE